MLPAPANISEPSAAVPLLAAGTSGLLLGDPNYHAPALGAKFAASGVRLLAPYRSAKRDPWPAWSRSSTASASASTRPSGSWPSGRTPSGSGPETTGTCAARLLRKVLCHTLAVGLCVQAGHPPLQSARLLAP